jgi:hypothetical protein
MHRSLILAAAASSLLGAAACSSSSATGSPTDAAADPETAAPEAGCSPYTSDADLTTPTVSFAKDIQPTLNRSCGIAGATCHGAPSVVKVDMRPYLGNFDGGTDAQAVVEGLVGVQSPEDPDFVMVKAGDPGNSFLMHKLDGDQCLFMTGCAKGQTQYTDCGQMMPYSSPPLDTATRDTIRKWIAQGAKNN